MALASRLAVGLRRTVVVSRAMPAVTTARWSGFAPKPTSVADLEHATGLERAELEAELRGETMFDRRGLSGPFGTREKPVEVPSAFPHRAVACTGGAGHDEHELLWFNCFAGFKHICPECGQFFVLKHVA